MTDWAPSCQICERELATVILRYPGTDEDAHVGAQCRRMLEQMAKLLGVQMPRPSLRVVKR